MQVKAGAQAPTSASYTILHPDALQNAPPTGYLIVFKSDLNIFHSSYGHKSMAQEDMIL